MISPLQKRSRQLWDFKRPVQKGFGWLDEGQKNQARPVWNRVNLRGRLMRKSFYTWLMTERNPKSNAPKAILADLAFTSLLFPSIQMTLMRSVAF